MAENNLLMTIVLVVAATLLFSGGLTGNATNSYRENFGFTTGTVNPSFNRGGEVVYSVELQGGYTSDGQPAIFQQEADGTKTVKDICIKSAKPFITHGRVVECRGNVETSSTDVFPGVY